MRLRAAAAVGALLLLLAACGDGGQADAVRESASSPSVETTTTVAPPPTSATSTTVAGRTTTTARSTTTTRRGAPTSTVAGTRGLTPAAAGTYRYDTSGSSTFAGNTLAFPRVTTLVVDPPLGTSQRLTRNLRDATGNGLASEFALDYRPDGVYLVSLKLTVGFAGVTESRELRPAAPVLIIATGARPGAHTEADLGGVSAAKLAVDVVGEEPVTVAGQGVDTLVVRATVTLAPGDITGRQQLTVNLDRGTRLWVRERSVTDASAAGGLFTFHSEYTATLQRLTP